jgi:hypothetical protein
MNLKAYRNEETGRWHMEGVEPETETYQRILEMLKGGTNFKFARYGDGELYCMTGRAGRNCDGHQYFPELGARLRQAVTSNPKYMVGIQPLSVSHLPEKVEEYFSRINPLFNADVFHSASIDGQLDYFFAALEGRYIILVGPAHLATLFDGSVHIVIPSRDCWLQYEQIKEQLKFHLIKDCVVLLCASMMSEVLICDLKDYPCTIIDTGSLFDPYANVKSRSYHHKLKLND